MTTTNDAPAPATRCSYCGDTRTIMDRVDGEITCPECGYDAPAPGDGMEEMAAIAQIVSEWRNGPLLSPEALRRIRASLASDASPRGDAVAWRVRPIGDKGWHLSHEPPRIGYEGEPLYAHPAPATVEMDFNMLARRMQRLGAPGTEEELEVALTAALAPATEGRKG